MARQAMERPSRTRSVGRIWRWTALSSTASPSDLSAGRVYLAANGGFYHDGTQGFTQKYWNGVSRLNIDPFSGRVHVDGYYSDDKGFQIFTILNLVSVTTMY